MSTSTPVRPLDQATLLDFLRSASAQNRVLRLNETPGDGRVSATSEAARSFEARVTDLVHSRAKQLELADLLRDHLLRHLDPDATGSHELLTRVVREEDGSESFACHLRVGFTEPQARNVSAGVDPLIPMLMLWLTVIHPSWFKESA